METRHVAVPILYSGAIPTEGLLVDAEIDVAISTHPCKVRIGLLPESLFPLHSEKTTPLSMMCMVGEEELPLISPPVAIIEAGPIPCDDPRGKIQIEELLAENKDALETFAQVVGLYGVKKVVCHITRGDTRAPLPMRSPDELDILFFAGPIAATQRHTLKSVAGIELSANGKGMPVLFPHCPLRGGVVLENDVALMQYIDNTIYVLFHPSTLTERGGVYASTCLLQLLLDVVVLWSEQKSGYETASDAVRPVLLPIDGDGVTEEMVRAEKKVRKECEQEIGDIHERIQRHEKELLKLRRELHMLQKQCTTPLVFSAAGNTFDEKHRDALLESIRRFEKHPLVAKIEIVSGYGIHLVTNELRITHESVTYRIGTIEALFMYDGNLNVWPRETHHPDGIPHPHIERETGMCLGNVSDTIKRALAEFRFGDAIEFFIISLEDGYTHENVVFHPVTEWPVASVEEVQ